MNNKIKSLRENILSALPLSMAKEYEKMNRELNSDKEGYYYKTFKKLFDRVFGKDEKGRLIYRKYINVDNMKVDEEIYEFLKDNGYNISEEEFNAGVIIKNKDDKNNHLSLEELQKKGMVLRIGRILNKKKAPQKLILKWDRISKEISNKKLIVISRHPYDIAGQSTDRAWQSCMTLPTDKQKAGCNSRFVDSGIRAGILIAYLINIDDRNINKPLARVLIKPYTNDKNKIYFNVSKIYGTAGNEFKNTVQKWVDKNLNKRLKGDIYTLNRGIYEDNEFKYLNLITNNYIKNKSNIEMYNENGIVYDKKTNILYIVNSYYNSYISYNSIKAKVKKETISAVITDEKIKESDNFYYDKKSNTFYSSFKLEYPFGYILLIDNEVITDFKTKQLFYKIDIYGNVLYHNKYINIIDNIIYINKKYKNKKYKGIDLSGKYKIVYTDKIFANDDNINDLVNDLIISLKDIDVSNVTDMSYLFYESERKDFTGIEDWNTSNVTDMSGMFRYNKHFNGNISKWNTSKVINMSNMFAYSIFNKDISKWDTSNVKDMSYMFCLSDFNGDISNWNVSNVEDMSSMFKNSVFNGDISKWNTRNVIDMSSMFENSVFNGNISKWKINNLKYLNDMFKNSPLENNPPKWKFKANDNTIKELVNDLNISLKDIDVSNVTDMSDLFKNSKRTDYTGIENWNVSNVKDMSYMFCLSDFNEDISKWNTSNVIDMSYMFAYSIFNQDISKWDVSNVKYMIGMFNNNKSFNQDISNWKIIKLEIMDYMFKDSNFNQDINNWNNYIIDKPISIFNAFKNSPLDKN